MDQTKKPLKPEDKPKRTRRRREVTPATVLADVLPKLETLDDKARAKVMEAINAYFA